MSNNNKKTEKNNQNSIRYSVSLFLRTPEKCVDYKLNPYHREILRVISEYCDMPLKYCCLKQPKLAFECGMGITQLKDDLKYLKDQKLLFITRVGKLNRYRIGEIICGIPNE